MKLFTVGPVQMFPEILEMKSQQVPYFRTDEFSELMHSIDRDFKRLVGTHQSSKTIYLTASGTGAMEAAVENCFTSTDRLLIVVGGTFGKRFSCICDIHGIPHTDIELDTFETLTLEHLAPYGGKGYTGFLVNLNETSTGQLYDINIISSFCRENNLLLMVDAISTFLADPYNMDQAGIDVSIISSQKGLCLSPGMSFVVINQKTIDSRIKNNYDKSLYFDFKNYLLDIERGQTPFTPAIEILCELSSMLRIVKEKGLDDWLTHVNKNAEHFRCCVPEFHASIPHCPLSNALTPVILHKPIAKQVFLELKHRFDIYVNPCGGVLADNVLRVAHVGNLNINDFNVLVDKIKTVLELIK